MFDRYLYGNVSSRSSVDAKIDVTEKRAPTDESVRLLREMEAAAREQIVATTIVRNTDFECVIYKHYDCTRDEDMYAIVYSLNSKKRTTKINVRRWDHPTVEQVVDTIKAALADDIASQMLATAFHNVKVLDDLGR